MVNSVVAQDEFDGVNVKDVVQIVELLMSVNVVD